MSLAPPAIKVRGLWWKSVFTESVAAQGESIYGPQFDDENFKVAFSKRGILGMANNGIHSNNSQVGDFERSPLV